MSNFSVSINEAISMIKEYLACGLVPMLHGSPGVGKSSAGRQVAKDGNLFVIDIRLTNCDPTDMNGFPAIVNGVATYITFDTFPTEDTPIPDGFDGWLIVFDEINSAAKMIQAAAYKILLDREVGNKKLNDAVFMMAAGNLATDGAIVERMSTALQSRMVHLEIAVNTNEWLDYAYQNQFDYKVTSYINYKNEQLQAFDPNHSDKTFACCRTWEFANRLIKRWEKKDQDPNYTGEKGLTHSRVVMLAGTISKGVALEFSQFVKIFATLPDINEICHDPVNTHVPEENSSVFALTGYVAKEAAAHTIVPILTYVDKFAPEFQIIAMKQILAAYPNAKTEPKFISKLTKIGARL